MKTLGYILYEGSSLLDGKPIVVIATLGSNNRKTGDMVQTWIMRSDVEPHSALKTGDDSSVCGNCPHRPLNGGSCYVTVFQAPLGVYRAYKRGRYAKAPFAPFRGRFLRIGSYGDPAAVPLDVWAMAATGVTGYNGYTHQWRDCDPALRQFCMASADSLVDLADAKAAGWRTFRVTSDIADKQQGEVVCPASEEAGKKLTCDQCRACGGTSTGRKGTIVIQVHGAKAKVNNFNVKVAA